VIPEIFLRLCRRGRLLKDIIGVGMSGGKSRKLKKSDSRKSRAFPQIEGQSPKVGNTSKHRRIIIFF